MCEILIAVVAVTNPNSIYLDTKLAKVGDVIDVREDGHAWGVQEQINPNWRIIQLPVLAVATLAKFLVAEVATSQAQAAGPNTLQYRGFRIDVSNVALPAALKTYLKDATRVAPAFQVNASLATLQALITQITITSPPIADPAIVG